MTRKFTVGPKEGTHENKQLHICLFLLWLQSAQFSSITQSCLTPCDPMNPSTPGLPVHFQLPEFTQTRWCHPAISSSVIPFSFCPQSLPASGSFQWVNTSYEVTKILEFQFSITPSNEHPELISFRMDWLDILAVQGTLKSLLQYHSSKASIFRSSAFFTVQLSHPYMTTGKTVALTRQTFVGKVMSVF